ncbi:hypothetical protein LTR28_006773, partial [Elasticomyces elasticus]
TIEDLEPAAHVLALALFNEEVFGDIIHPHRHEYPDDTYIFFLHKLRAEWIKPSNRILVATAPITPPNGSELTTSTITGLAQWTRKSTATDATHDTTDPPPATWDRPPYPQTARWTPQQKTSSSAQTRISSTTGAAGAPRAGTSPSSGCIRLTTDRGYENIIAIAVIRFKEFIKLVGLDDPRVLVKDPDKYFCSGAYKLDERITSTTARNYISHTLSAAYRFSRKKQLPAEDGIVDPLCIWWFGQPV